MKNKILSNKGITLIALVITIIVLLILVGIVIAALTGENGILSRATEVRAANALGEAKDKCALIAAEEAEEYYKTTYVNQTGTYSDAGLDTAIVTALNGQSSTLAEGVTATIDGAGTDATITLTHTETSATVEGTITNGTIAWNPINYGGTSGESQGGSSGGGNGPSLSAITPPSGKTLAEVAQGDTITIGTDTLNQFMVLSNTSGTIMAMPYYNITLSTTNPEQTSTDDSTTQIKFVNESTDVTWSAGENVNMATTNNNIQQYIAAYQTKLQGIAGSSVTAEVGRKYDDTVKTGANVSSFAGQTNSESKKLLDPSGASIYWLGSSTMYNSDYVNYVNGYSRQRSAVPARMTIPLECVLLYSSVYRKSNVRSRLTYRNCSCKIVDKYNHIKKPECK